MTTTDLTSSPSASRSYDAVIVGARCAGAATALRLARQGLRVLAVERGREGADTLSTHALMRGAVLQLRRWGLLERVAASGAPAIRSTTFHYGDEAIPVAIKPRDGVDALYAPRRTVLDPLLVDAAREAGAEVVHGWRVVDFVRDPHGPVAGVVLSAPDGSTRAVRAGLVVGADGIHSTVARLAGAPARRTGRHATAVIYGYWPGLAADGYRWFYRPGVSVGAIPTNGGLTCVFVSVPARRWPALHEEGLDAAYRRVLAEGAPELAAALAGRAPAGPLRGFPGVRGYLRRACGPGWALVGDAGFFRDPLTAHGITDALRDAELLARAAESGSLRAYEAARDAHAVPMLEVTDAVASFDWDLARVKELHLDLSRAMAAEVDAIRAFDEAATAAPAAPCPLKLPVAPLARAV